MRVILGLYEGFIKVILGLFGVLEGFFWGSMGYIRLILGVLLGLYRV